MQESIDRKKYCVSISENPGTFGRKFHNQGYFLLDLNFEYIPLKILSRELPSFMEVVSNNFHGCSVSMPHKIEVMRFLKEIDPIAKRVGAVNTILNYNGHLSGYNTDYLGAKRVLQPLDLSEKYVLMVGAGGVARAIGSALVDLESKLFISNRDRRKGIDLSKELGASFVPLDQIDRLSGNLLVNATSVGMSEPEKSIVGEDIIKRFDCVMDAVIGETKLLEIAKKLGKKTIPGKNMTVHQAAEQFKFYTGKELPLFFLEKFL